LLLAFAVAAIVAVAPAKLLSQQDKWTRLHTAEVDPKAAAVTIEIPENSERVRALQIAVTRGPVALSRLQVTYANGQVHFENRTYALQSGERTNEIDAREEARGIQSIELAFQTTEPATQRAEIEIWGLVPPAKSAARNVAVKPKYVEVPVFYGTTRKREKDRPKGERMLATFSGELSTELTLGRSIVTVPIERNVGTIPRPDTNLLVTRIAFRNEDPNRDFTIAAIDVMPKDQFIAEMKRQSAVSNRYKGQALVFVHGYNVSFDDAIFRTAQIAHDILFDGPVILFSWPSRGGTWDYIHDINTAKGSREGLRTLLETLSSDTDLNAINLIAHSMGNDPVIEVLREEAEFASRSGKTNEFKLNEIVLAAPDVSRSVFEQFAPRLVKLAKGGVTLFASSNDRAMNASKRIASGLERAGDVPKSGIVIVPGVESIDVSEANTEFFSTNHSTFAIREHLVTDLRFLFERTKNKHPPDLRYAVYRSAGSEKKPWWRYKGGN